jgi:hypothetical protein
VAGDDLQFRRIVLSLVEHFPYVDEDWVISYAQEAERRQRGMGISPLIDSERLRTEAQDVARTILRRHWHAVIRIVAELRANQVLSKLQLRDLLVNRR